jgi:hypothetical protein
MSAQSGRSLSKATGGRTVCNILRFKMLRLSFVLREATCKPPFSPKAFVRLMVLCGSVYGMVGMSTSNTYCPLFKDLIARLINKQRQSSWSSKKKIYLVLKGSDGGSIVRYSMKTPSSGKGRETPALLGRSHWARRLIKSRNLVILSKIYQKFNKIDSHAFS